MHTRPRCGSVHSFVFSRPFAVHPCAEVSLQTPYRLLLPWVWRAAGGTCCTPRAMGDGVALQPVPTLFHPVVRQCRTSRMGIARRVANEAQKSCRKPPRHLPLHPPLLRVGHCEKYLRNIKNVNNCFVTSLRRPIFAKQS